MSNSIELRSCLAIALLAYAGWSSASCQLLPLSAQAELATAKSVSLKSVPGVDLLLIARMSAVCDQPTNLILKYSGSEPANVSSLPLFSRGKMLGFAEIYADSQCPAVQAGSAVRAVGLVTELNIRVQASCEIGFYSPKTSLLAFKKGVRGNGSINGDIRVIATY